MTGAELSRTLQPVLLLLGLTACRSGAPRELAASVPAAAQPAERPEEAQAPTLLPLELRILRAGREVPAGLSAVRAAELEQTRARAAEELAHGLRPDEREQLACWLAEDATAPELWSATARCVTALEAYELAPFLARALEPGAREGRAASARTALHALFGCWFRTSDEVEPFLDAVRRGPGTRLLVAALLAEQERSRQRLLVELEHRPHLAESWLSDLDPEIRAGAARALARATNQAGEEPAGALLSLAAHLEGELDPGAFHEALLACVQSLERVPLDHPASLRLRALLVDLARGGGNARAVSLALALARLPWRAQGPEDTSHVMTAIRALGALTRALAEADRRRGLNDPDPLVAVLAALRQLSLSAHVQGLGEELRGAAVREGLLELLGDAGQAPSVRAAAAAALGLQASSRDVPVLVGVLSEPDLAAPVKHALLGALGEMLPTLEPSADEVGRLAQALVGQTAVPDADLRRRAVALLADRRLEPFVRELDPGVLLRQLALETDREATLGWLGLVARHGRPDQLPSLLALARFEALCEDPATLDALVAALGGLARDSAPERIAAARRLVSVASEATLLKRLRRALVLVAEASEASARALLPEEHRQICAWTWQVMQAGVAPRDLGPQGARFTSRILEVHLPRAASAAGQGSDPFGAFEAAHLAAVLKADLCPGGVGQGPTSKSRVEDAFQESFELAPTPGARWLVLRDRARFRSGANEGVKALADYRRLLEAGPEAEALLSIPDLRTAHGLLDRLDVTVGDGRSATAAQASALLSRIVHRPEWLSEPSAVRLKDLQGWVHATLEAGGPAELRGIEDVLGDLPQTQGEGRDEPEPLPLWHGLTREAEGLRALLDLRARVRARLSVPSRG